MTNKNSLQSILENLDHARQKLMDSELTAAFEIIEKAGIQIDQEKSKAGSTGKDTCDNIISGLISLHSSLKRKLLKEMAKNL